MSKEPIDSRRETNDWKQRVRDEFLRDDVKVLFGNNLPTIAEATRLLAEEAYARTGKYGSAARMIGMSRDALHRLLQADAEETNLMSLALNNGPRDKLGLIVLTALAHAANAEGLAVCGLPQLSVLSRVKERPLRGILIALERDGWIARDPLVGNGYQINLERIGATR